MIDFDIAAGEASKKTEIIDYVAEQQKQRATILESIATHGLISAKSADRLKAGSQLSSGDKQDSNLDPRVCGAFVVNSEHPDVNISSDQVTFNKKNLKGKPSEEKSRAWHGPRP